MGIDVLGFYKKTGVHFATYETRVPRFLAPPERAAVEHNRPKEKARRQTKAKWAPVDHGGVAHAAFNAGYVYTVTIDDGVIESPVMVDASEGHGSIQLADGQVITRVEANGEQI